MRGTQGPNGAKYYVYRNLHKDCFSIKYRGKVIAHAKYVLMRDVEFKVNDKGRRKVIETGTKNVHAYVVGKAIDATDYFQGVPVNMPQSARYMSSVTYNPRKDLSFICTRTGAKIERSDWVWMDYGIPNTSPDIWAWNNEDLEREREEG